MLNRDKPEAYFKLLQSTFVDQQQPQIISENHKKKKIELNSLRDVYIIGLAGMKGPKVHGDALKNLKVRYEMKEQSKTSKTQTLDPTNFSYQERDFVQDKGDPFYYKNPTDFLIDYSLLPNQINKFTKRLEELSQKYEVIDWGRDQFAQFYLFCKEGEFQGSYIKLEVFFIL